MNRLPDTPDAMNDASSAKSMGETTIYPPRSGVILLKVVHNRPFREWVCNSSEKRTVVGNFLFHAI